MQSIPLEKDELIGKDVYIKTCVDPNFEELHGIILDETKNMILIETEQGRKWIAKDIASFSFLTNKKHINIHGSKLRFRPEERIKKVR
jgi:ribonuclease P protein subunit POP4